MFSFALSAAALVVAGPASALSLVYSMTGSSMAMTNQLCTPATCNVAVTGTVTLDDDEAGNVSLTGLSLSHAGYQVASPAIISVILTRTNITLGAGSVAGTGSTLGPGAVSFGSTTIAQTGTTTCANGFVPCASAGFPGPGSFPMAANPDPTPTALGNWVFDAGRNFTAVITYTNTVTPQPAVETLTLVGTVPEPGTFALVALGLAGLGLRRRAVL